MYNRLGTMGPWCKRVCFWIRDNQCHFVTLIIGSHLEGLSAVHHLIGFTGA